MKMVIIHFQDNEMEKEDTGTTTETQYEYTVHPKLSHVCLPQTLVSPYLCPDLSQCQAPFLVVSGSGSRCVRAHPSSLSGLPVNCHRLASLSVSRHRLACLSVSHHRLAFMAVSPHRLACLSVSRHRLACL